MNLGFNTEVRSGEKICHVQTEVRGLAYPVIETLVYVHGQIFHRRSQDCADLAAPADREEDALRPRVEDQHRAVIADIRAGAISFEVGDDDSPKAGTPSGIEVQLLNPASWVSAGTATLEIEVLSRENRQALPGVRIEVALEGTQGPICFTGRSDERGRAQLSFPMPRLGPGGAELIIRAESDRGADEVRYALRPKPRPAAL